MDTGTPLPNTARLPVTPICTPVSDFAWCADGADMAHPAVACQSTGISIHFHVHVHISVPTPTPIHSGRKHRITVFDCKVVVFNCIVDRLIQKANFPYKMLTVSIFQQIGFRSFFACTKTWMYRCPTPLHHTSVRRPGHARTRCHFCAKSNARDAAQTIFSECTPADL